MSLTKRSSRPSRELKWSNRTSITLVAASCHDHDDVVVVPKKWKHQQHQLYTNCSHAHLQQFEFFSYMSSSLPQQLSENKTSALLRSILIARPPATPMRSLSLRAKAARNCGIRNTSQFLMHAASLRGLPTQPCLPPRIRTSNNTRPPSELRGLHVGQSFFCCTCFCALRVQSHENHKAEKHELPQMVRHAYSLKSPRAEREYEPSSKHGTENTGQLDQELKYFRDFRFVWKHRAILHQQREFFSNLLNLMRDVHDLFTVFRNCGKKHLHYLLIPLHAFLWDQPHHVNDLFHNLWTLTPRRSPSVVRGIGHSTSSSPIHCTCSCGTNLTTWTVSTRD